MVKSFTWKNLLFFALCLLCANTGSAAEPPKEQWKEFDGVTIPVPPREHPRLYVRSKDIPELRARLKDPALQDVWKELQGMRAERRPDEIPEKKDFRFYFNQRGATVVAELDALDYLVNNNKKAGRNAIRIMCDTLRTVELPDGGDVARGWGLMMVCGAIVYDWCYDLLTEKEKESFVKSFVRLAGRLECGYPPVKQGSISGHSSEWMIMRDLLSAGIAIYDEFPEMYNLGASRFFREHLPARNFFYPGHNYHQGTSYFNVRFANDLFPLWIFDKMGFPNIYHPSQQFVLYDAIYRRRPDGQVLPAGDENPTGGKAKSYSLPAFLASSYYKDEYLNYEFMRNPQVEPHCKIFELLWRDTKLGKRSPDDLPLTRYSGSPFGWMIARTGWDENSVIAEMKINEYHFMNHQHLDAGAFQIYYKGPLAIDAGTYQGTSGGYNSPHNKNFFKRTIAHNSLLVMDPDEKFACSNYGGADRTDFAANDGGQRMPGVNWGELMDLDQLRNGNFKVGTILSYDFGPDRGVPLYSYLKGDIAEAYTDKVKEAKRSFVFLNFKDDRIPAALVVFDKVVSTNPDFKKYWLLHSIEEPAVAGNRTTIMRTKDGDNGMLYNITLLPETQNSEVRKVGGPGKEFWVFGTNYPNIPANDPANERGEWRIELSPKKPSCEDLFLNVMQVADNSQKNFHEVGLIDTGEVIGVGIADRIVTFSKDGGRVSMPFTVNTGGKSVKFLLTDLLPGTWQIQKDGKVFEPAVLAGANGIIYFEGPAGEYRFLR